MIGYYGRSTFGGYFDFQINERWGVQTGMQTVQQVGTNRYKAEPIVTPYYRINKKVAIGLPVVPNPISYPEKVKHSNNPYLSFCIDKMRIMQKMLVQKTATGCRSFGIIQCHQK